MLSDRDIREALDFGELAIDPLADSQIQPASVDLTLGNEFKWRPKPNALIPSYVDPLASPLDDYESLTVTGGQFGLKPGGCVLASTVETVRIGTTMSAEVAGKSSLGRHFLTAHVTAGHCDPGFAGMITLEIVNHDQEYWIMLTPGMAICQLLFFRLDSPCLRPYGSKKLGSRYQGQLGPTPSRSHLQVGSK